MLQTDPFTHRRFYTQTLLHTYALTHRGFYTQKLLHRDSFTHRSFDTQTLVHTDISTEKRFYTETLLHRNIFTQRRCGMFFLPSFVKPKNGQIVGVFVFFEQSRSKKRRKKKNVFSDASQARSLLEPACGTFAACGPATKRAFWDQGETAVFSQILAEAFWTQLLRLSRLAGRQLKVPSGLKGKRPF